MDSVAERFPKSVDRAIDQLLIELSFGDKTRIANMSEAKLVEFHKSYGSFLRMKFRLPGNDPLMESCRAISGLLEISGVQASYIILKELWNKLQESNVLKVIK